MRVDFAAVVPALIVFFARGIFNCEFFIRAIFAFTGLRRIFESAVLKRVIVGFTAFTLPVFARSAFLRASRRTDVDLAFAFASALADCATPGRASVVLRCVFLTGVVWARAVFRAFFRREVFTVDVSARDESVRNELAPVTPVKRNGSDHNMMRAREERRGLVREAARNKGKRSIVEKIPDVRDGRMWRGRDDTGWKMLKTSAFMRRMSTHAGTHAACLDVRTRTIITKDRTLSRHIAIAQ